MARDFGWEDSALQYLEAYQWAALQSGGGTSVPAGSAPH
jgi:hypothetical protein